MIIEKNILSIEAVIRPGVNPFAKIITLDWYDGPVAGVVQFVHSTFACRFEMLAWDGRQDIRVFSLAPLSTDCFQSLVEVLSGVGDPHWPAWAPNWGAEGAIGERMQAKVERLLNQSEAPEWVVAWQDVEREGLLAVHHLDENNRQGLNGRLSESDAEHDWFAFLGLTHSEP